MLKEVRFNFRRDSRSSFGDTHLWFFVKFRILLWGTVEEINISRKHKSKETLWFLKGVWPGFLFYIIVYFLKCTGSRSFHKILSDIDSIWLFHCRTAVGTGAVELCFSINHGPLELQARPTAVFVWQWLQIQVGGKDTAVCFFNSVLGTDLRVQKEEGLLMQEIEVVLFPNLSLRTRWDHTSLSDLSHWLVAYKKWKDENCDSQYPFVCKFKN